MQTIQQHETVGFSKQCDHQTALSSSTEQAIWFQQHHHAGFMLQNPDDAVIWRGPRKNALIKQFLKDVDWGSIDYLVVDAPPG